MTTEDLTLTFDKNVHTFSTDWPIFLTFLCHRILVIWQTAIIETFIVTVRLRKTLLLLIMWEIVLVWVITKGICDNVVFVILSDAWYGPCLHQVSTASHSKMVSYLLSSGSGYQCCQLAITPLVGIINYVLRAVHCLADPKSFPVQYWGFSRTPEYVIKIVIVANSCWGS